jgi:hypothetical protein
MHLRGSGALLTGQDQAKKLRVVNRIFSLCSTNLPDLALLLFALGLSTGTALSFGFVSLGRGKSIR